MTKRLVPILTITAMLFCFGGCDNEFLSRDYLEDICVPLENRSGELIIREWTYLLGSGVELYYRKDGKMTPIGQTGGGDDGFCPFAAGMYEIDIQGDVLTVKWAFQPYQKNLKDEWRVAEFTLPSE